MDSLGIYLHGLVKSMRFHNLAECGKILRYRNEAIDVLGFVKIYIYIWYLKEHEFKQATQTNIACEIFPQDGKSRHILSTGPLF